jgi:hypothetical protein
MPDNFGLAAKSYDYRLFAIAAAVAAGGAYFVLAGFELVPSPSELHGPIWLATLCGLAFLLAGIALALRAYLRMDDHETDVPPDAPLWARMTFWLTGVGIAVCLALIGSWIAFGDGERRFSMSGLVNGPASDTAGRVVFGLGAVFTWFAVVVFVRIGYRRIFGRKAAPTARS